MRRLVGIEPWPVDPARDAIRIDDGAFPPLRGCWQGMAGLHGIWGETVLYPTEVPMFIVPLLAVVWLAPNTQTLTGYNPARSEPLRARPRWVTHWPGMGAAAAGCLFALSFLSL